MARAAATLVAALLVSPAAQAAPCAGFTDVDDTSAFCGSVAWMKNRAITLGCTATLYCPNDFVRRDQMAAFMYRLGFQNAFLKGGNAFGATATLGTTDAQPLDVIVGSARVVGFRPETVSPNIVAGHPNNAVLAGSHGQVVAGGGMAGTDCNDPITGLPTRTCGNATEGNLSAVGGGASNVAYGNTAVIAGGFGNTAGGGLTAVGGGSSNIAQSGWSTVVGGRGNRAMAQWSTVLGGLDNVAAGLASVAAGHDTHADQDYCMVFGAWSTADDFGCLGSTSVVRFGADHGLSIDYFGRRPDGGGTRWVYMGDIFAGRTISTWNGAHLTDAGVWVNASSSQAAKTDFVAVDAQDVLAKVAALPITTWRYREGEEGVRHIGPMAEDFHAAFGVGYGPQTIADLDARGVALAAIQGLHRQLAERDRAIDELRSEMATLRALREEVGVLREALRALLDARPVAAR